MRVLVTGNEGYIGSILVPKLKAVGHEVRGLDSGLFRECTITRVRSVPTIWKDVRDVERDDLEGFDAVVHLAGLANDPLGDLNPALTEEINHVATVRLAEVAKQAGVRRFLYASTCSIYGAAGDHPVDEDSTPNPLTAYARSKAAAERDLKGLADRDFCPVYLRAATAYGASPFLRFDLAVNNLVAWAYATSLVYLKSDGTSWRPIVHVEDICRAYISLLDAPEAAVHNQAFNVGRTNENYRIRELAEIIQEIVPGTHIEYAKDASPDRRSYRVNCDRLPSTVHAFTPQWNARTGAREVFEAIRDVELSAAEFEGPRYNRIAFVRNLLAEGRLHPTLRWSRQVPRHPEASKVA